MNCNKIIRQFIPPILYRGYLWKRVISYLLLRLYGLLNRSKKVFYEELIKQLRELTEIDILFPEKKGVALNINEECVAFMREEGIETVCGNAENLEFEDSSFDFIFCFQILEHCPNPIKVLNK